ncbi:serine/threonine-protein kinase [Maioricimonas rarisocia]|uniref:serine/threonine-protein kinase n=1 Tax=Maioricimonas rarisocia TaxID=2528026 RepID=UPI0018D2132C|nr:serine/threonine-protein kinase [Maioricimonas rarisocia]
MDVDARYELLDKVGSGSFATVYRARDIELGREVAIKQIHAQFLEEPQQLERYWAEAQLLASLQHPNIVTMFDIVRERGWLVMELMQGNLRDRLAGRQMDLRSLRSTVAHSLRALKYLHSRGVIHGDIKPSNLMIDHRRRVKLGDFGLARRVSDAEGSLIKGTTKYMAPELVAPEFGEVGPQSDLYSLGFTAYELMCGADHFEDLFPGLSAFGRDRQAAWMMWHAAPDRRLPDIDRVLEGVPEDLSHVIQKLTQKDPSDRYETADEALSDLKIDLKLVRPGGDVEDAEEDDTSQPANSRRWVAIGAFALSLLMSVAMLLMPTGSEAPPAPARTALGVVREVNVDERTIEYEDPQSGVPAELTLSERPRIYSLNEEQLILLKKVQPGDWIEIERAPDSNQRIAINLKVARPVESEGTIRSIDGPHRQIAVSILTGRVPDDLILNVPERAPLTFNGQRARLSDFSAGDRIRVEHVLDPTGTQGHIANRIDVARRVNHVGYLAAYDPAKNEIAVASGKQGRDVTTWPLAEDVEIHLKSGEPLTAEDLREDDRLELTVDTQVHQITVHRDQLRATGTVATLDPDAKSMTLQTDSGDNLDFRLAEDAEIRLSLEPATLSELRPQIDTLTVSYSEDAEGQRTISTIDAHRGIMHDRWAIVIGTEAYTDVALSKVPYAVDDAQLVYESLVKRYAVDRRWATRLLDENAVEVRDAIRQALERVAGTMQLVVYVNGHAYVGDDDQVYLALKDFDFDGMQQTGLPLDWLVQQLEASPAEEKILLLDVVQAGDGPDLKRQPSLPEMIDKLSTPVETVDIIGSSDRSRPPGILKNRQHGAFADLVARGFAGAADANRDLRITGDELFGYLQRRFAELADETGGQKPFRSSRP